MGSARPTTANPGQQCRRKMFFAQMNDFSAILLDAKAYSLSGCQERLLTDLGARRAIPEALGRGEIPRGF
jgi:hypothetical protein